LVERLTGGKALPPEVVQVVVAKTDGVPLFVEECTKAVLESGVLRETAGGYARTGPLTSLTIPTTLHDSLMARLDRLTTAKAVAQIGATLGRQFSYDLLQAVSPLDEATLYRELGRLVEAELLYQRGIPPQAIYQFKHTLIQDAAYQSLLRSNRQQYHQRIAQVLIERFPETAETQPEVVAQHYTAAGLPAEALPYWQRAGHRALERSAYREAVASFEQGLAVLQQLPACRDTREQAIDMRLALRSALFPSRDFGRILTCLHEAEALAEALADSRRLGQIARFLSASFYYMGVYDQAATAAQRALTLATTDRDDAMQAVVNYFLGTPYQAQGDYRRAIDCYRQTAAFFAGARRHVRFGQVLLPAVQARARLAWCQAELGMFAEGRTLGEEGLQIAEAVDQPASRMFAAWGMGRLCLCQGDLLRALPLLERAIGICQDADLATLFPEAAAALGAAYTLGERSADAVALLRQAMEQAVAAEMVGYQTLCGLPLSEAYLLAGRLEEASSLAEQVLMLIRRHQERGNQAYALRLLGDIAARREPPDIEHAEPHYQHALALAGELGMRPLQAHCHRRLGMLYSQTGYADLARAALSTAIEMYQAMDMTFWLPAAEAALRQVGRP
jgi:tetratricopeptide (TPR) repeat protein